MINYRIATNTDHLFIKSINEKCSQEHYDPSTWKILLETLNIVTFVSIADKQIIGYIILCNLSDNTVIIASIAVLPEYRRQGIASELLTKAIHYVRQTIGPSITIDLHVRISNPAQQLYKKFGFKIVSIAYKYYMYEDAYYMTLTV